jgi:lipopolysaccharide transport system ATP-binding protein
MSSDNSVAIRAVGLSKSFKTFRSPFDKVRHIFSPSADFTAKGEPANEFRALDDVSFEVGRGKAFGIMGQNGSGKSTLLQIISGIMAPTAGSVFVKGKVAALLELGSGFNPEFTGRENVYLNASVLGLSKSEIDDKFDAIADFAEIGEHIELPVKTYSSGMMLRLAFAVQVAIEPEILIIDEALAVGDAKFQVKCFRRLDDLKAKGTTILFVSHATELVKSFCDEAMLLQKGKLVRIGNPNSVASKYYSLLFPDPTLSAEPSPDKLDSEKEGGANEGIVDPNSPTTTLVASPRQSWGVGGARVATMRVHGLRAPNQLPQKSELAIDLDLEFDRTRIKDICREHGIASNLFVGVRVDTSRGVILFDLAAEGRHPSLKIDPSSLDEATVSISCTMPVLAPGDYFLTPGIAMGSESRLIPLWSSDDAITISIGSDQIVRGLMRPEFSFRRIT